MFSLDIVIHDVTCLQLAISLLPLSAKVLEAYLPTCIVSVTADLETATRLSNRASSEAHTTSVLDTESEGSILSNLLGIMDHRVFGIASNWSKGDVLMAWFSATGQVYAMTFTVCALTACLENKHRRMRHTSIRPLKSFGSSSVFHLPGSYVSR